MNRKRTQPLKSKIDVPWDPRGDLFDNDSDSDSQAQVSLEQIQLPQQQPRRYFDPLALKELVESVKLHGILQPLLVRPLDQAGKYELVAGERRYRAALEVGLTEVPVVVRELSDEAAWQFALIENLQREDLNPVEETEGIVQLLALRLGLAVSEISPLLHRLQHERKVATSEQVSNNVIGNSEVQTVESVFQGLGSMTWESFVNNRLPLLNLPSDILDVLRSGAIAYTKAKVIAQIKEPEIRQTILSAALANNWSLNEIKQQIKERQPQSTLEPKDLPERFTVVTRKLKKSPIWSDPNKRQQLENLLAQMEALTTED